METFKVICKAPPGGTWIDTKGVHVRKQTYFFGLLTKLTFDIDTRPGPLHDEVCIVKSEYLRGQSKFYNLAGYPYGGYDSKLFVNLSETSGAITVNGEEMESQLKKYYSFTNTSP